MTCRPAVPSILLLAFVLLVAGCRGPQLVSRPMTPTESSWAGVIQRSYPGWRAPFFMPSRADWQPRPPEDMDLPTFLGSDAAPAVVPSPTLRPGRVAPVVPTVTVEVPEPAPIPVPVAPVTLGERQTVIDLSVPHVAAPEPAAPVEMVPPIRTGGEPSGRPVAPARSAEPNVEPTKVLPPRASLKDVEFVPADATK
ncbi:MAG: hypothetical protein HN849_24250 [Victivallales bacterium]|jgi:hypothetical protein|nr:hypothetical protein [Victivallales bacterium]MBT7163569.1 hypothetical protein [Victivallales bacterium]MBT7302663.1 hypothetical protein [Victivallales bacterium]